MQPEISHRCPSCGATVRERGALFCPDCGKALPDASPAPAVSEPNEAMVNKATAARELEKPTAFGSQVGTPASHPQGIADKTRQTLHRASAAARGVIEEPVKRVEKFRHASTHVIEEASYDPSLRFVLVALGLFVVFLILLVVSKLMG